MDFFNIIYTSVYPYFIIVLFLLVILELISRKKFFSIELHKEELQRLSTLDGLRGFLALNVFFHHSIIMYYYYITGVWKVPPSSFYTLLGEVSVPLFFMITGFLFWIKILEGKFSIKKFYLRRVQRIAPLYIFTTLCVIFIVIFVSGFTLFVEPFDLFKQIIQWFSFAFFGTPDINGFKNTFTIESVYWTLRWEWIFYFILPFLVFFKKKSLIIITFLLFFSIYFNQIHFLNFSLGILAASIWFSFDNELFKHFSFRLIAFISLVLCFLLFSRGYGKIQSILLFIFFISILYESSLFGLLKIKATRLLGMISYSIYLVHNIVLWIIFKAWNLYDPIVTISPLKFWILVLFSSIIAVFISTLTYKYIEHYFYIPRFVLHNK